MVFLRPLLVVFVPEQKFVQKSNGFGFQKEKMKIQRDITIINYYSDTHHFV